MLKFTGITKSFKTDFYTQRFLALNDVSFDVPSGSMVGFLGANGAGKTTSLKIIMDFIRADAGTVSFTKEMGESRTEVFKNIGFLPERPYFYANLKGREFLHFMGNLSEVPYAVLVERIKHWAPRFRIDHALEREIRTYSKGMLQRIGFLATILHEPKFIILDEPLSGLDPIGRKELKDVMIEVHRAGKTVFFSSHIVPDIEEICDRVIFLKEGKLVFDGTVESLLHTAKAQDWLIKYRAPEALALQATVIQELKLAGNLYQIRVEDQAKDRVLSELVGLGTEVVGLEVTKPSLEEIFYHRK